MKTTLPNPAPQPRYQWGEQALVDRFTLGHANVGAFYAVAGVPWPLVAPLAIAWELAEEPLKDAFPQVFPDPKHDMIANTVVDALAVVAAYWLTRALLPRCPYGSCPGYR